MKKKLNAYQKIQAAMRAVEREVLTEIRKAERRGEMWCSLVALTSTRWSNALGRLEDAGKIRFVRNRRTWGWPGYKIVKKGAK